MIRKNEGNQSDLPLTISAQHGLVDQRDYFNNQVASRDMSGYYLLENGEFAYNKSTSGDSPWGAIKRLTKYEKGCLSTLYICFGLDLGDPDFLVTYYETNRWHGAVQMIAAEGARNHGLLNIAPDDFFETVLTLPCSTEEQKQIGCFFTQLNSLITLHQRKRKYRGLYGYLSWEQRKLGDCVGSTYGGGTPSTSHDEYWGGDIPWIQSSNVLENELFRIDIPKAITQDGLSKSAALQVPGDSIAVVTHVGVGKLVYLPFPYATSQDFVSLSGLKGDANFLCYAIHRKLQSELHMVQGSAIKGITKEELLGKAISLPAAEEQKLIGNQMRAIDNLITLHQRMGPIFCFCAHGSRTNFASTLQG